MHKCCSQSETTDEETRGHYPKSHYCPANGKAYSSVKRKTLLHHISDPWHNALIEQGYYFCTDPGCDVVYFGQDNTVLHARNLRTAVWQKSQDDHATICYCFGVTKQLARTDNRKNGDIKTFITEQTKQSLCSCETSNPSGRCFLKYFPATLFY
jgi:hypothetical protein